MSRYYIQLFSNVNPFFNLQNPPTLVSPPKEFPTLISPPKKSPTLTSPPISPKNPLRGEDPLRDFPRKSLKGDPSRGFPQKLKEVVQCK